MNNNIKAQLRNFGLIWSLIFLVIALQPLLKANDINKLMLAIAVFFLITSLAYPKIFQITNFYSGWIKFGNFVGKINSKIIIFILFYFVFLPIGIILKILKKDLLNKKIDKACSTYFIDRKTYPSSMKNQF